jgi:hypothetical protein
MKMDGVFFRDEEKEVFRIQHIDLLIDGWWSTVC